MGKKKKLRDSKKILLTIYSAQLKMLGIILIGIMIYVGLLYLGILEL